MSAFSFPPPNDPFLQPGPFTGDQTFTGKILAHSPHGIALNADGNLDGNLDTSGNLYRIGMGAAILNGINSTRGGVPNSITVDAADGAGATFFTPIYLNETMQTEGSLNSVWSQISLNEPTDTTAPAYAEGVCFFASVAASRQGALAEGIEADITIASSKQSRANAGVFSVSEPNTVASYAAVIGATSEYSVTGSRVVNVVGAGAAGPGTGVYVHGSFGTAAILVSTGTPTTTPALQIYSGPVRSDTNNQPFFSLDGKFLRWGAGGVAATDVNLYRSSAGVLKTDNTMNIGGNLQVTGTMAGDPQTSAASVTTARATGPAAALPANPLKYIAMRDETGARVYVAAYS